jgi:chemotaxis signal transduction protein
MREERASVESRVDTLERKLFVFFEAGGVRYALPAVSVIEVAVPDEGGETVRGHLGLRDLSIVLGGEPEPGAGAALVLDTSPTRAIRVGKVDGAYDVAAMPTPALTRRIIPLLSPAVRGTFVRDGALVFELELDAVTRGLPKQTRRVELHTQAPKESALVFVSNAQRLAVPLTWVRQVVPITKAFNRAPGRGGFLGALEHRGALFPLFHLAGGDLAESLAVLLDVRGEGIAVTATAAEGVKSAERVGEAQVLDVERMFS